MQSAMLMLLVLGFIALGVEISQLLLEQRKQQSVADSAAMAAASAVKLGVTDLQAEARAVTAQLGYRNGVNGVTVTAANPPSAGTHSGDTKYVEVKVQRAFTPALTQLFRRGSFTVKARSVAMAGQSTTACITALETSGTAIDMAQNTSLTLPGCGIATNSTSSSSVALANNATLSGSVTTAGDVSKATNATITGSVTHGATATANPYTGFSLTRSGTTIPNTSANCLQPGIYNHGWNFSNGTTKCLAAGVYFVQSQMIFKNNVTLTGTGVTIVIDGNYAMDVGNNLSLTLSAPTTGPSKGFVLYSPATNSSSHVQTIRNNATLNLSGAIYLPNQTLQLQNNVTSTGTTCTQIVAKQIALNNNAVVTLKPDCTGVELTQIGTTTNSNLAE